MFRGTVLILWNDYYVLIGRVLLKTHLISAKEALSNVHHTNISLHLFGIPVERIGDLPRGHEDQIDEKQYTHDHEELVIFDHLLVQFYVGKNGMYSPSFAEHCAESQRETGHKSPRSGSAYVRERIWKIFSSSSIIFSEEANMVNYVK